MSNGIKCTACGFPSVPMKVGKSGGYSGTCPECKTQMFARSPKAAAGIAAQLGGAAPAAPAAAAKKSGIDFLED